MKTVRWVGGLLFLLLGSTQAQTIYESKQGKSTVFSDQPSPGAKPVDLRPLNVISAPPPTATPGAVSTKPDNSVPAPAVPTYRSLAIVFPEAGGSVAANTATFEVRVSIDPPLQIGNGHAFVLRMDGRNVPGRYTATEMMVPPEFFGNVQPAGVQQHVLEASVVDVNGSVILSSAPVSFQTRFVTVLQNPGYAPKPMPLPGVRPQPKLLPEDMRGATSSSGTNSRPSTESRR